MKIQLDLEKKISVFKIFSSKGIFSNTYQNNRIIQKSKINKISILFLVKLDKSGVCQKERIKLERIKKIRKRVNMLRERQKKRELGSLLQVSRIKKKKHYGIKLLSKIGSQTQGMQSDTRKENNSNSDIISNHDFIQNNETQSKRGLNEIFINENEKNDVSFKSTQFKGILKKKRSQSLSLPQRKDVNGNIITSGQSGVKSQHQISFHDTIEQVNLVENWKSYNTDSSSEPGCTCNLI